MGGTSKRTHTIRNSSLGDDSPPKPTENEATNLDIEQMDVVVPVEPCEDITPRILDEATYGYAAIYIHAVTPKWDAYNEHEEANRPLDQEHVKNLAESMKNVLKIADAPDRVCITMTKAQIEQSMKYTVRYELYGKALRWYSQNYYLPEAPMKQSKSSGLVHSAGLTKNALSVDPLYPAPAAPGDSENNSNDLAEEPADTVIPEAKEDPTPAVLDQVTFGYAAVHIYSVDPNWNRDDKLTDPNRPLDLKHAENLAELLRTGLRIADGS